MTPPHEPQFDLNRAGFFIVGLFVAIWVIALSVWRFGRVEQRWDAAARRAQEARGETPDRHAAGQTLGAIHAPFTIDE